MIKILNFFKLEGRVRYMDILKSNRGKKIFYKTEEVVLLLSY